MANAGHGHPAVSAAGVEEIRAGRLFSYCFPTQSRIRLAKRLTELVPEPLNKAFLLTTGSEATENALKLARTHGLILSEHKNIIVSFDRAFHGRTLGAQHMGGFPAAKEWIGGLAPGFIQVPFPDGFRSPQTDFAQFEHSLAEQGVAPERVAGVIMESYQGGGASFAPVEYVHHLRDFCSANEALLIFDEVQSGFGRTGKFFAFEHYGVVPDLVCLGKGISSGLPVAAVLGPAKVMDIPPPGSMTSTHGGNPVCCASALANLDVLSSGVVEDAAKTGSVLEERLRKIAAAFPEHIGAVHGKGLVWGVHCVRPGGLDPDPETAFKVVEAAFTKGLLLFAPVGLGGATVKLSPPLVISEAAVCEAADVLAECFALAADKDGWS